MAEQLELRFFNKSGNRRGLTTPRSSPPPSPPQGTLNLGPPAGSPILPATPNVSPAQGSLNFAARPTPPLAPPAQGSFSFGPPRPTPTVAPQPSAGMTPQGQQALDFLNRYKAAQASTPPAQGSPGFTGPPRPTPQGTISRAAGATANAARTVAGVAGRGLAAVGTVPLATGAAMLAYPSKLGNATLNSPEAQKALADNEEMRSILGTNIGGFDKTYIPSPEEEEIRRSRVIGNTIIPSPEEEAIRRSRVIGNTIDKTYIPSPEEEIARRSRMPVNTIAGPGGFANIQRGTEITEPSIANPQEAERVRIAGIKGRISPENPYGADVVGGNMRTGQVRGISTQEEADRNLQSRLEQDAAAQQIAASYNRSTEALRDLRAERRGISRNALDIAEGRVEGPAAVQQSGQSGGQFGDEILDRDRFLRQFQAPAGASDKVKMKAQENMAAAQQVWNQNQQAMQKPVAQAPGVNPLDAKRLLVDMQNNAAKQGIDKERLLIDKQSNAARQGVDRERLLIDKGNLQNQAAIAMERLLINKGNLQNQTAKMSLEEKKQDLEEKAAFTENFTIGKEGAPDKILAAGAWEISKATGVPAEIVQGYIQNADFDWENGPPKNMTDFFKNITAQITRDYRGQ